MDELTIKQALLRHLQVALSSYILDTLFSIGSKIYIPLQLSKQQPVIYRCAIAFKLSQVVQLSPLEVANAVSQLINQQNHQQNLTSRVVPPGWIDLELTQLSLAAWLQGWTETLPSLRSQKEEKGEKEEFQPIIPNSSSIIQYSPAPYFPIQYAHARCCSLLQMAHREGLIKIKSKNFDNKSRVWGVVSPQPIPWLGREGKLCFNLPGELNLIIQLVAVLDALYCPEPTCKSLNWLKVALQLSQTFQTFYSQCRIWGEVKNQNLPLAQGRLGLVALAQSVLKILLVDVLGSCAPPEL